MTQESALDAIKTALVKAVDTGDGIAADLTQATHLIDDGLLDSLDSAVFLLEMENATGVKLSDKAVEEQDLFKVGNLVAYVEQNNAGASAS